MASNWLLKQHKKESEAKQAAPKPEPKPADSVAPSGPEAKPSTSVAISQPTVEVESKVDPLFAQAKPKSAVTRLDDAEKQEIAKTVYIEAEIPGGIEGFKQRLEVLNMLIEKDQSVGLASYDTVRGHVKQIMIDLKEQPELDSCLIDRDVHNILAFIRSTKMDAVEVRETKKAKTETRAKNKAKKGSGNFDLSGGLLGLPGNLNDFGKMDL